MIELVAIGIIVLALAYVIANKGQNYWSKNGIPYVEVTSFIRRMFDKEPKDTDCRLYKELKARGLPYAGIYEVSSFPSFIAQQSYGLYVKFTS